MARGEVRTTFALQATALSAQFNELFGAVKIPPGYVADLTAPDGPSTGGGKQSLQRMRLLSPDGGAPLLMGSLDPIEMKAVVRTHAHLEQQASKRGARFTLESKAYKAFAERVEKFYEGMHFVVEVEDAVPETEAPADPRVAAPTVAPSSTGGFSLGFVVGCVVGIAIGAVGTYMMLHH